MQSSDFGVLRLLKVKTHDAVGVPVYDFLLVFHSEPERYDPMRLLRGISLQKRLGDLDVYFSNKVKYMYDVVIKRPRYDFCISV